MNLTPTIYDRIEDVPEKDWAVVVTDRSDLAMDRRLLGAFQSTIGQQCRCWFVIFRDNSAQPVAAACLGLFEVDALETTTPTNRAITQKIRKAFPSYMRFGVLFCGLPLPSGASHLRWTKAVDPRDLIDALDALMRKLAKQNHARLVVVKELDETEIEKLSPLRDRKYVRGEIPRNYELNHHFASFDEYFAAIRSNYRKQITRSQKRFKKAGGSIEVLTGEAAAENYTDAMHALYVAVRDHAQYRLETFPAEFFRETARRFGENAFLSICRINNEAVGFTFGIKVGHEYHNLYVGLDYAHNAEADVYFNLYYHDLDRIFRLGCTRVHVGQTSEDFKARLGCEAFARYFYVRAVSPLIHMGLRRAARWVFPAVARVEPREIYLVAAPSKTTPRAVSSEEIPTFK